MFDWVAPDRSIINQAIDSDCDDFEGAVQFHSAVRAEADFLVTRDAAGFPGSGPAIVTPAEFLASRRRRRTRCRSQTWRMVP